MWDKARYWDLSLFFAAVAIAFFSERVPIDRSIFVISLFIFWLFSSLYYHLRVLIKNGQTNIDYGISYSFAFVLFAGPLGLFIFESLYRFTVYVAKKRSKTADPGEFLDTLYNIGVFVVTTSIGYYLYVALLPFFQQIPFGYWILVFLLTLLLSILSNLSLMIVFFIKGDMKTFKEAYTFFRRSRASLDIAKVALTNGLLYLFLQEQQWEMMISLFILNYIVSRSFISKEQNIEDKMERDKFEQMAYTDFLTGIPNRAFMDKIIAKLNQSEEYIGIVVVDIDKFKRINDNYNHAVGDQVIRHFAETLNSFITKEDYLFRSGGEEFTLFLRGRTFEHCQKLVKQIQMKVEKTSVEVEFRSEMTTLVYTASFGLYYIKINEKLPMEKGYVLADHLLLQSKQSGRNTVSAINGQATQNRAKGSV
ncbi:GGDEF domain-containing protein [Pseudoneobacillus sp. C159]